MTNFYCNNTRREFLAASGSALAISMGGLIPQVLLKAADADASAGPDNILVVVQLSGGNDGLNTVVPFDHDVYKANRPKLAIDKTEVLKINDQLGFHPAMRGMADLLEGGKLSVIQGVGYPNPNRSHFESMDIWHTCQRKDQVRDAGWLGKYLDGAAESDVPAIHFGFEKQPFALAGRRVRVPSIESLESFQLKNVDDESVVNALTKTVRTEGNNLLDFVQTSAQSALRASERIKGLKKANRPSTPFPETRLGEKLERVAQLIAAKLPTRVYYVELDGFDTHAKQDASHEGLLRQFSGAVKAFIDEMQNMGLADRVMVMAFSEFGRRVEENASNGTDHGTAGPVFLAGSQVKPGLIGELPNLNNLKNGDLEHHTDFRQVYACVLENWLKTDSQEIIGQQYRAVDAIKS
ncbi:MAG: hypothetical protein ACI9G1_001378 [Pirellulaceae bacterium]|jgi:uncharacterized protein (DUF1501 family)